MLWNRNVFSCWNGCKADCWSWCCVQFHNSSCSEHFLRFVSFCVLQKVHQQHFPQDVMCDVVSIINFDKKKTFTSSSNSHFINNMQKGACYAEFGVRVPHTSGSAYMYSYVSVGEFVAFVIGWNMILEYLIGTSACACALSASFDSLLNGAISNSVGGTFGTVFGRPPDFIAFTITLLMTCVLACGASKSVMFNNVLNTINLAAWVFIMVAGLFYVDTSNWSEHDGFLPYGVSY